jgi:hypothetical protein
MTLEEMIRFVSEQAMFLLSEAKDCDLWDFNSIATNCREEAGALMCVENELRALAARQARAQD